MSVRIFAAATFITLVGSFAPLFAADVAQPGERWSVSIRSLPLGKGDRIVGFSLKMTAAAIASLPSLPIGWRIEVDNDPSWNTTISGSIVVGAAALDADFFQDFLVIEKHELRGTRFAIDGIVEVTKDFDKERKVRLSARDFLVTRKK